MHSVKQASFTDPVGWSEAIHNMENKEATFRIDRLEPVNGKIPAKSQNFLAQKAGVLQRLFCRNPYEEFLIKAHWNDFISLARRKKNQFNVALFA